MLLSQHMIVGSAVAIATNNPYLGFLAALVSHQVLDALPHVDGVIIKKQGKLVFDRGWTRNEYFLAFTDAAIAGMITVILYLLTNNWLVFLGALGGALTDILDLTPWWRQRFRATWIGSRWHSIHSKVHFRWKKLNVAPIIIVFTFQILLTIFGIMFCLRWG